MKSPSPLIPISGMIDLYSSENFIGEKLAAKRSLSDLHVRAFVLWAALTEGQALLRRLDIGKERNLPLVNVN